MPDKLRRPTYANLTATLALVLAVAGGGVSVAAGLGRNTVGSPQIKDGQVRTADLGGGAVTGAKVKDGSVTGADVAEGTLGEVPSATDADEAAHATSADQAATALAAANADYASRAGTTDSVLYATVFGYFAEGEEPYIQQSQSRGAVSIARTSVGSVGQYRVTFDRDVSSCTALAAISSPAGNAIESGGTAATANVAGQPTAKLVQTRNIAGDLADRHFAISVLC